MKLVAHARLRTNLNTDKGRKETVTTGSIKKRFHSDVNKTMNRLTINTPYGSTLEYYHYKGLMYPKKKMERVPNKDIEQHIESTRKLKIRDDDVYLATFEKSGTHWVWEILMMLKKGNTEYETQPKEHVFLDYKTPEHVSAVPSPRILNAHFPVRHVPTEVLNKKTKIVHVMRNPKDIFVSLYHHVITLYDGIECESFGRFLQLNIGTYGIHHLYPWFQHVKEWERFTKQHPEQILNLYYEDIKEDPVREIKKMNEFLECKRSLQLMQQIAEACSFKQLKYANDEIKVLTNVSGKSAGGNMMFRKGEVGDWKNWFTVADNEKIDTWLKENLVDTDLIFRYELHV